MFIIYFKSSINNLLSNKLFAGINIIGLAIGLTCCLLIVSYIRYEFSFDEHYQNAERIVRVAQTVGGEENVRTQGPLAGVLNENAQGVEKVARFVNQEVPLSFNGVTFNESHFAFADEEFLDIFDFQWLRGSPAQALNDPSGVVITESTVNRYFGDEDPMGQVFQTSGGRSLRVTGVIADLPGNTHFRFSALASMEFFSQSLQSIGIDLNVWYFWFVSTYVLLESGYSIEQFQNQLPGITGQYTDPDIQFNSTKLTDIYLHAPSHMDLSPTGDISRIFILAAVALCVLFIAVVNFMTLSTARSSLRAVEVGLRKSIGAFRGQIAQQFFIEAFVMVCIAMVMGLAILEILLPVINTTIGKNLSIGISSDIAVLGGLILFTIVLTVTAGSYPAWYLSSFKPAKVLKGEVAGGKSGKGLRNVLVILQFSTSIFLIVASTVIYQQIKFTESIDLGFEGEDVVVLDFPGAADFDVNRQWDAFSNELKSSPGIVSTTHSQTSPLLQSNYSAATVYKQGESGRVPGSRQFITQTIEPSYYETYQLELLAGRWLSDSLGSDRLGLFDPDYQGVAVGSVVLNEQAAKDLGWSAEEAVGQQVAVGTISLGNVIGVVKDTLSSIREEPSPQIFYTPEIFDYTFGAKISIRLSGNNLQQTLNHIEATWDDFFLENPSQPYFLLDRINAIYQLERQQMEISTLASILAILIACSGLYGLAAFNAEYRTKEISIRKVMGGSAWSIVLLLTNDFSKLVLISNVIAWPAAYIVMSRWLENFAYRIDLTPIIFVGSGLIALCIVWVTVGGTAVKAANQKPVLALRYE